MQHNTFFLALTTIFILSGCQTLPGPISDLRSNRPNPVASDTPNGTPLTEILARQNARSEQSQNSSNDSQLSDSIANNPIVFKTPLSEAPVELSIGLSPDVGSATINANSDNRTRLQTTLDDELFKPLETNETLDSLNSGSRISSTDASKDFSTTDKQIKSDTSLEVEQDDIQPETIDLSSSIGLSIPSVSDQLNWLPTLEDTLAMMDARVQESSQLDDKIDALMSLAYVVDAQLYIAFRDLLDRLDGQASDTLIAEQQAWLGERKNNLTRAYLEFEADKAGRYNAAQAFLRNSHERMRELESRRMQLVGSK